MKRYIIRNVLVARLAALALSAVFFLQPYAHTHAQGMIAVIVIFPSVGVTPGESLRLTLFNKDGDPVRVQARLHTSGGIQVALADGSVRAGAFDTFEFKRSDIHMPSEERTGRIQLSPSFNIRMSGPGKKIDGITVSMETISISDGTSNTVFVGEIPPSRGGEEIIPLPEDVIIGFVPNQRVRLTLTNPPPYGPEAGSEARRKPVIARVKFFDESGNLIAQSDELVIPPGEFRSADLNRDALSLTGELGTGRLQARGTWQLRISDSAGSDAGSTIPRAPGQIVASYELIDNSTGKTKAALFLVTTRLHCSESNGVITCQ